MPGRGFALQYLRFHFLTATAECLVIDIKTVYGAADRFMLQLDLANRSEYNIYATSTLCACVFFEMFLLS